MTSEVEGGVLRSLAEFERVAGRGAGSVLLAFTAEWCAPCRWLYPHLDALSGEDGPPILRVDIDRLPAIAARYGIGSVPTVLLVVGGVETARSVGVEPDRLRTMYASGAGASSLRRASPSEDRAAP